MPVYVGTFFRSGLEWVGPYWSLDPSSASCRDRWNSLRSALESSHARGSHDHWPPWPTAECMPEDTDVTVVDRLWNRLETRYGDTGGGCDCLDDESTARALADSPLSAADLRAYRDGDREMADLVDRLDLAADPADLNDLADLAAAVEAERQ